MRIRLPFAGVFVLLLVVAGYAGLSSLQLGGVVNDKLLHLVTFFLLTVVFYWIVDTSRRRTLHMALVVCTFGLGIGSELLQAALPGNGRVFDVMDIAANLVGSLAGLGLCSWYHKRMLERKRHRKYTAVPGEEGADGIDGVDGTGIDLELGEGVGAGPASSLSASAAPPLPLDGESAAAAAAAVVAPTTATPATAAAAATTTTTAPRQTMTLEQEVDNWDENAQDAWGDEEVDDLDESDPVPAKKRID